MHVHPFGFKCAHMTLWRCTELSEQDHVCKPVMITSCLTDIADAETECPSPSAGVEMTLQSWQWNKQEVWKMLIISACEQDGAQSVLAVLWWDGSVQQRRSTSRWWLWARAHSYQNLSFSWTSLLKYMLLLGKIQSQFQKHSRTQKSFPKPQKIFKVFVVNVRWTAQWV